MMKALGNLWFVLYICGAVACYLSMTHAEEHLGVLEPRFDRVLKSAYWPIGMGLSVGEWAAQDRANSLKGMQR